MTPQQKNKHLAKFLSYILERHPDEFGLVPDSAGYVKIKELLKALNETEGWRHIRESNINELLLVESNPPVEIAEDRIRAKDRQFLPKITLSQEIPKILYTCIRKKAHAHVLEKGIQSSDNPYVICSPDRTMAERLGNRKDRYAICLTIHTSKTVEKGISFYKFTDLLYLAEYIPAETFTGPPIPKTAEKEKAGPAKTPKPPPDFGTFTVTPEMIEATGHHKAKGKKKKLDWKQDRKNRKKGKNTWPDGF